MSPYVERFANSPHSARQTAEPSLGDRVRADQQSIRNQYSLFFRVYGLSVEDAKRVYPNIFPSVRNVAR